MKKEKVKDKVVGVKLDAEQNRWIRAYAEKKTNGKLTPVIRDAIEFLKTRAEIEQYILFSLGENLRRFPDAQSFMLWCDETGRPPARPVGVHIAPVTIESYVIQQTYRALEEWHRDGFDPATLEKIVYRREHWFPPSFLNETLDFTDEAPAMPDTEPAAVVKKLITKVSRKAKATA